MKKIIKHKTARIKPGYILLVLCFFWGQSTVFAGNYGRSFLDIGFGARALGMGGAFAGIANDGYAFYWNPAGVSLTEYSVLSGMYGSQFGGIADPLGSFHHIGFSHNLPGNAAFSVNWVRFSVDDIPVYSELQGNSYWERFHNPALRPDGMPEGYIQDVEDAIFFTFGINNPFLIDLGWEFYKIRVEIPIGINLKWFRQKLGEGSASGMGMDIGGMLRIYMNDFFDTPDLGVLSLGVQIQDFTGSSLNWNTQAQDAIPSNVKWGLSYEQRVKALKGTILVSYDEDSRYEKMRRMGIEYQAFDRFAIRIGKMDDRFTAGAGFMIWRLNIDYAFLSHELDALHRISCSVAFK